LQGVASESERQNVDLHLKGCSDCSQYPSFIRDFSDTAKELAADEIAQDEPHPQDNVIIAYEDGSLDKETSLHVRSHMLFCDRCAETYYLLKRMRAPSWTEAVIEAVRSAKEWLLKPLEITGVGELVPVPAVAMRDSHEESAEAQAKIEIIQHVTDSGDEADIVVSLKPQGNEAEPSFLVRIDIDPPKDGWRAQFFEGDGKRLASVPLTLKSQIVFSNLPVGSFIVHVEKDDELLAKCSLAIRRSSERTSP
jgi:hypothetical protein